MKTRAKHFKTTSVFLALLAALNILSIQALAASLSSLQGAVQVKRYAVSNPYENVDWQSFGQYKANFHTHTTNSDGGNTTAKMVEDYYEKGYDIVAMTDHSYLTKSWSSVGKGALSLERESAIMAGTGRAGRMMYAVPYSNEQSWSHHVNTFWADFNSRQGDSMESYIAKTQELGGMSHINHPGRFTGGSAGGSSGAYASNDSANIKKCVDIFMKYPSCLGMEIINKTDNESRSDRILWDNILKETMPKGRGVWGFANDDAHSTYGAGYAWNVLLIDKTQFMENGCKNDGSNPVKKAMQAGAFYAVSRVARREGVNATLNNGNSMPGAGTAATMYLLEQPTPSISDIKVGDDFITVTGADCDAIEWIADGVVIFTGPTLCLSDHPDEINSYVRAQLKSGTGIAFTQPFAIKEIAPAAIDLRAIIIVIIRQVLRTASLR